MSIHRTSQCTCSSQWQISKDMCTENFRFSVRRNNTHTTLQFLLKFTGEFTVARIMFVFGSSTKLSKLYQRVILCNVTWEMGFGSRMECGTKQLRLHSKWSSWRYSSKISMFLTNNPCFTFVKYSRKISISHIDNPLLHTAKVSQYSSLICDTSVLIESTEPIYIHN